MNLLIKSNSYLGIIKERISLQTKPLQYISMVYISMEPFIIDKRYIFIQNKISFHQK